MIIKYPTGLYYTVLPHVPSDAGNVTYTISNTAPPRSSLLFQKIPIGVVNKKKPSPAVLTYDRRESVGELIFTVSKSIRSNEGNNARQYEIGQVFDFEQTEISAVDPMLVSEVTEIRHDTNRIDYDALGLTVAEQQALASATFVAQKDLMDSLNEVKRLRANAEENINSQQKIINDTNRAISGINITLETTIVTGSFGSEGSVLEEIIAKLKVKATEAIIARDQYVILANDYAAQAASLTDQLRSVGVLVK